MHVCVCVCVCAVCSDVPSHARVCVRLRACSTHLGLGHGHAALPLVELVDQVHLEAAAARLGPRGEGQPAQQSALAVAMLVVALEERTARLGVGKQLEQCLCVCACTRACVCVCVYVCVCVLC